MPWPLSPTSLQQPKQSLIGALLLLCCGIILAPTSAFGRPACNIASDMVPEFLYMRAEEEILHKVPEREIVLNGAEHDTLKVKNINNLTELEYKKVDVSEGNITIQMEKLVCAVEYDTNVGILHASATFGIFTVDQETLNDAERIALGPYIDQPFKLLSFEWVPPVKLDSCNSEMVNNAIKREYSKNDQGVDRTYYFLNDLGIYPQSHGAITSDTRIIGVSLSGQNTEQRDQPKNGIVCKLEVEVRTNSEKYGWKNRRYAGFINVLQAGGELKDYYERKADGSYSLPRIKEEQIYIRPNSKFFEVE